MARRLPAHDAVRGDAVEVRIADQNVRAFADESIAAAALASGTRVLSRSLKYHRPRTFFCLEGHCSGCLVRLGGVPNLRACQAPCTPGAVVEGQNAFPSAEVDLLGAVDFLFSRGLDHHTLMTGSSVLNRLANKVVRQLSGLGKLPATPPPELRDVGERDVDVCVIGGGPAGLAAAIACAHRGRRTLLIDDQLSPGGSMRADPNIGAGDFGAGRSTRPRDQPTRTSPAAPTPSPAAPTLASPAALHTVPTVRADLQTGRDRAEAAWLGAMQAGVEVLARSTAIGFFPEDDGGVVAVASPERLYRVHARAWIWTTGGYVVNLPFVENDRPGVIAARAVGRLLVDHGILAGEKVCIVEVPQVAAETDALAHALGVAGADVARVALVDTLGARGRSWVSGLDTTNGRVDCDLVAVAAIPSPASEGPRQHGCKVVLDPDAGGFRVVVDADGRTSTAGVWAAGDVTGYMGPQRAAADGARVGANVAASLE